MRAIFFGTPQLAVPSLDALVSIADVPLVVCQPDRPAGRGLKLRPPPVKERALELGIEVVQPTKLKAPELAASLRALEGGARRAVMKSAPFDQLPKDKYETWKVVELSFYPSEMM